MSSANQPEQDQSQDQDRGPGAQKVELERRLDANQTLQERSKQSAGDEEPDGDAGARSPSEMDGPEYYSKDQKPTVAKVGTQGTD